jgi:TetR/AcrR family transcriptional regulator of autoinduction and epiphytic fitness
MAITVPDRRAALKARHREAILDAARTLLEEQGPSFTVDELAERADVARRTVFNHFPSLDDVRVTVCAELLTVIVDELLADVASAPVGNGTAAAMFDELAGAIRAADLPDAISTISRFLGSADEVISKKFDSAAEAAFDRVGERLLVEALRRNPGLDVLDAQLIVSSLTNGLAVIASHWLDVTGGAVDAGTRSSWDALLTRLITGVRSGFAPTA